MRALAAILVATLFLAGPAVAAERPFDRACMDDYGRDLCDSAMRAKIRASFGLPSVEELAAEGFEGVRVFTINGYSHDMPPVSILRRGAGPPKVEVSTGGVVRRTISTDASPWDWLLVETLSRLVTASPERQPKPAPSTNPGEISICLHAWVTITEVISNGRVVRRIRNACDGDPIFDGAFQLSTVALGAFQGCWKLDPAHYRNDSERLIGCAKLKGDNGYGAASLLNALEDSPVLQTRNAISPDRWLDADATVVWPGEALVSGRTPVAAAWTTHGGADPNVRIESVEAATFKTGTVVGVLYREMGRDQYEQASFRQDWVREEGVWRLTRWTVESFRPASP
ncbi:MAG: hypothetical protein HY859_07090 [Caulobacterales bacterium]|nr:hypothetical protein [Caulobacterales bacterium]